ncbi:MAG: hypothetical protein AB7N76_35485 [Planctomycetota bacterium]
MDDTRRDRATLWGYGCLVAAVLGGGALALGGALAGLASYFRAQQATAAQVRETGAFLGTLEAAVAWCGAGALGLLVATGALVILLKEMADDTARKQRGDV